MVRLVEYRGNRYEVVEDHGILLMLVVMSPDEEDEFKMRRRRRFRFRSRLRQRLGASLRRRRFVLAERDEVKPVESRDRVPHLPLVPVSTGNASASLPLALLQSEIGMALGCAACQAACAASCRKWSIAFDSGTGILRSALHRTVGSCCRHDPGSLRARAVLRVADLDKMSCLHVKWFREHIEDVALDDFDPRVRACALRAAKSMNLNLPLEKLKDAVYDDWKSRRNLAKYESWHNALRPLLEQEDWSAYERMVQAYSAVHAAGQRAALDVIGASFLHLWQSALSAKSQTPKKNRITMTEHTFINFFNDEEDDDEENELTQIVPELDTKKEDEHNEDDKDKELAALVEFVSGLTTGYSQRRIAREAIANWDTATSQAYLEATIHHAFAPAKYRRRSHAQHQALVDMLTPAAGCGPALAEAILLHLDDATELQRRLAARHALQIVVDGHAHRVAFIAQRLLPAIFHLADCRDYSRILHHLYHCCIPSTHAVLASLRHALFCAAVALAIATILALFFTLGNHFVSCLQLGLTDTSTCPYPSTLFTQDRLDQSLFSSVDSTQHHTHHYFSYQHLEHAASCLTDVMPYGAFFQRHSFWYGEDVSRSWHDQQRTASLAASTAGFISSAASSWTKRALSDAAASSLSATTSSTTSNGDFIQLALPGGFTWTEFALIVMYSLFLPFLLIVHLVWLIDDFLVELQFLHCSRPFRDACVRGLLASIGGPPSTPPSLPALS